MARLSLLAGLLLALAACSQPAPPSPPPPPPPDAKPMFDQQSLQRGVLKILLEKYSTQVRSVTCPAEQEVKVGASFLCTVQAGTVTQQVTITVRTQDGQYEVSAPR